MVLRRRSGSAAILAASLSTLSPARAQDAFDYLIRGEVDISRANDAATLITWDAEAWLDFGWQPYRVWIKTQGDVRDLYKERAEDQLLLGYSLSPTWTLQAGGRHDWEPLGLNYAVLGLEGLGETFETDAALFLSEEFDLSARIEQAIDIALTTQLIVRPHGELIAYASDVHEWGLGAGLTDIEAGLALRYEITSKVAPYIDLNYRRKLGETAILTRASGADVAETTVRSGIRFWF